MIQHICDGCGRAIDTERELRFHASVNITAVIDPLAAGEETGDRDYLLEIHELLERFDEAPDLDEPLEYDRCEGYSLCADCARRLAEDPLRRQVAAPHAGAPLEFSEN